MSDPMSKLASVTTKSRGIYYRHPMIRVMERSEIDTETGCWTWTGPVNWNGYARIYDYRVRRYVTIHRLSYMEARGSIPDGLQLDHLCRNTRCTNPDHLEPVTCLENMRRRSAAKTHCKRGHEYTPENTYIWRNRRSCRACQRARQRVA